MIHRAIYAIIVEPQGLEFFVLSATYL